MTDSDQTETTHAPGCKRIDQPAAHWVHCAECERIEALEAFRRDALRMAVQRAANTGALETLDRIDRGELWKLPWEV
jgi:hypothetical protein